MPGFPAPQGRHSRRAASKIPASLVVNLDRNPKRLPCLVIDSSKEGFRPRGSFHLAALGRGHILFEYKFDHLAAPKIETSSEPETFFGRIDDEAGQALCVAVQIDDQAGGNLRCGAP